MKKNVPPSPENSMKFIMENLKFLAMDYDSQISLFQPDFSEILPDDIAETWNFVDILPYVQVLYNNNVITDTIVDKLKSLDSKFELRSKNGMLYDKTIWTAYGLEKHDFWNEVRLDAKELLLMITEIIK